MDLYKRKYVEASGLSETINEVMSAYVVMCAQFESMWLRMKGEITETRKSRQSVLEQLQALDGGQSSSTTTKKTEVYEEYV